MSEEQIESLNREIAEMADVCIQWEANYKSAEGKEVEKARAVPVRRIAVAVELPGKIDRICPRCRCHAYHWLVAHGTPSAIKTTKQQHTARCASCGHQWLCRVMQRDV